MATSRRNGRRRFLFLSIAVVVFLPVLIPLVFLCLPLLFLAALSCLRFERTGCGRFERADCGRSDASVRLEEGGPASILQQYLEDQIGLVGSIVAGHKTDGDVDMNVVADEGFL